MNLLGRFDGTGPGSDTHFLSADAHPFADFHHRPFGPEMAAGQLVGLRDTDDLAHPLEQFDIPRIEIRAHAHGAKHRVSFSGRAVHVESHGHQAVNHVLDLVVQSPFLHHNNHVTLLSPSQQNPREFPAHNFQSEMDHDPCSFSVFSGAPSGCIAVRSTERASSKMRSNSRRMAVSGSGPEFARSAFSSTSRSRSGGYSGRFASRFSFPISIA